MGQGAHAGSPGGLVAPHQGHPRAHPVHKLKVENAILHPKVCPHPRRSARSRPHCDPDLHAYPPASPASFMCPFRCTTRPGPTPQETALRGGDNAPARRCDLVHFQAPHGRCGGFSRLADSGGLLTGCFREAPSESCHSFMWPGTGLKRLSVLGSGSAAFGRGASLRVHWFMRPTISATPQADFACRQPQAPLDKNASTLSMPLSGMSPIDSR